MNKTLHTAIAICILTMFICFAEDNTSPEETPRNAKQKSQSPEKTSVQSLTNSRTARLTGEQLHTHLRNVQLQAIREAKPPLPNLPLTEEQIQKLVNEKLLPRPGKPLQPGMLPLWQVRDLISRKIISSTYAQSLPRRQDKQ